MDVKRIDFFITSESAVRIDLIYEGIATLFVSPFF